MSEENERFKKMIEDSQDWFWEFDENANFTYVSPRIRELLGYEPAELTGLNAFDLMDAEEASRVHDHFDPLAEKYLPFQGLININTHKDGRKVIIESSGTPIFDSAGRFRGYRGIDRDVTQRKQIEDELRLSEEKLKKIVELLPQTIYEADFRGKLIFANQAAFDLFGYNKKDFAAGLNVLDMIAPEDIERARDNIDRLYKGVDVENHEYIARRKDGSTFPVMVFSNVVTKNSSPIGIRGLIVDISTRKLYEQALKNARDEAERVSRAKDEFLANMSHELRTPLTAILGFTELLSETALSEQQKKYLGTVVSSTDDLLALVNDLLDLARIEAGKVNLERNEFSLRALIDEIAGNQRQVAETRSLAFRTRISADVPDRLIGDPLRLKQVLLNLTVNAIKFSEDGVVTLSVAVETGHKTTPLLRFDVADTGIGMRQEDLVDIFEPFSQLDPSLTRKHGGAGLGLSICKKLLDIMGGNITVDSCKGAGSTFHVHLPFEVAEKSSRDQDHPLENDAQPTEPVLRLLLTEDNEASQHFFSEALKSHRHHVDVAANGAEALNMIQNCTYDLVLMDVQMPVMNGIEAISKIRELEKPGGRHLPVVALTAHAREEDRIEMLKKGFDGYISKPTKVQKLLDEVNQCLERLRRCPLPRLNGS